MKKIACNNCGAGKKLFFRDTEECGVCGRRHTIVYKEYKNINVTVQVKYLSEGCPKCGSKDVEVL